MSRTEILARVRAALDRGAAGDHEQRTADARERVAEAATTALAPKRVAGLEGAALIDVFITESTRQLARILRVARLEDAPAAVSSYLMENGLPPVLQRGSDRVLGGINWAAVAGLVVREGPASADTPAGLSMAFKGIAETGTLVLASGAENPVSLAFLPETHVIVLREADIVATYEEAFTALRTLRGAGSMPRTLNLVSGPSRTADIGGKIVIGAHGPRRLAVVLVGD